ncbi:MAG: hypothetical protein ACLUPW_10830 [Bifidobacterium pseudocatenulatum]
MLNIVSRAAEPSNLADIAEVEDGADAVLLKMVFPGIMLPKMAFQSAFDRCAVAGVDISWASMPAILKMRWSATPGMHRSSRLEGERVPAMAVRVELKRPCETLRLSADAGGFGDERCCRAD